MCTHKTNFVIFQKTKEIWKKQKEENMPRKNWVTDGQEVSGKKENKEGNWGEKEVEND